MIKTDLRDDSRSSSGLAETVERDHLALLLALDRNFGLDLGDNLLKRRDELFRVGAGIKWKNASSGSERQMREAER